MPMHGLPACDSLLLLCSPVTQHVPIVARNSLHAAPSYPRRPACNTPRGVPGFCRPPPPPLYPHPIRATPTAHGGSFPASVPRLLHAGAAVWASPAALTAPDSTAPGHRDLELAYLRGHVAGLDRRTEGPPPPKEAAQRAPPAPQGPAPDAVGEATPALLLAPAREAEPRQDRRPPAPTEPRQDRRPPAPTEPPRRPQGATYRRSRSPRRDLRDDRRDHGRTSPGRGGRTAHRRPYRSPERYYRRRSEERPSERRAPAARGGDRTPDRRDYRSRRSPPGSAPGPGRERRGPDDRRRYRSPSPDTRRVLAATGTPGDPGQPAAGHAGAGPPRPGPSDVAAESVSQDLLGADCREEGHQQALASAPGAPAARPQAPAGNPVTAQTHDGAEASAPPTGGHPPEGPALDWCTVCRFWRPSPCDQCPPQEAPQEEDEAAEQAPEGERELRPRETSPALGTPTSHAADDPPPPPIDVDASQGTATQPAGLLDDEAGALSPLEPLPPAVELDDDPAPPAAGRADSPPSELGPHEANPCKALDVAVFLDSERLSAVGRRMRAAGQDTTPVPGPHSPEGDGLPPLLAQYAKRTRELLQLVGYTLGVPSFSLSSWEGDAIPAPHPPGLGITVYYVIEGRVQLRLPAPEGGTRPGWWLQAMAYAYA